MKKTSTTLLVFGICLVGMGLGLVLMPDFVLSTLGFPPTDEVWTHVVGALALVLAFYYISASRIGLSAFARMTVPARIGVFILFTVFTVVGWAGPVMVLLGGVDLLGALWTGSALRAEG